MMLVKALIAIAAIGAITMLFSEHIFSLMLTMSPTLLGLLICFVAGAIMAAALYFSFRDTSYCRRHDFRFKKARGCYFCKKELDKHPHTEREEE